MLLQLHQAQSFTMFNSCLLLLSQYLLKLYFDSGTSGCPSNQGLTNVGGLLFQGTVIHVASCIQLLSFSTILCNCRSMTWNTNGNGEVMENCWPRKSIGISLFELHSSHSSGLMYQEAGRTACEPYSSILGAQDHTCKDEFSAFTPSRSLCLIYQL